MKMKFFNWAAILAAMLFSSTARATDYTYIGGAAANWEAATSWSDPTFLGTPFPNAATDNATVATPATITIGTAVTVGTLALNSANTFNGAGSLTATTITTSANNTIAVNLAGAPSTLTLAAGNVLNFTGTLTTTASQTIQNNSTGASTVNFGAISVGGGTTLSFRVNNAAGVYNFNNDITGGGGVAYFGPGTFNHKTSKTYTGTTALGANSPNASAVHVISTDAAFGTGRLNFTGGAAAQIIRGDGTGTRTLANQIQLQRGATFDGTDSINLTGQIYQSNSRNLDNNIVGGTLRITGDVFTANSNDGRIFVFGGSGNTVLSSTVHDRIDTATNLPTPLAGFQGSLSYRGSGRLTLDNGFAANYTGFTEITSGTMQLGVGGAAVNLNGGSIRGDAPSAVDGLGTLEVNQNTSTTLGTMSGQLNVVNRGTGTLNLNGVHFGTGTIQALGGTVNINGGTLAATAIANASRPLSSQLQITAAQASNLMVGQSLTVEGDNLNAGTGVTTHFINELFITGLTNNGNGTFNVDLSGNVSTDNVDSVYQVAADAGTGTGLRSVVANAGRVAGNGIIGGSIVAAPAAGSVIAPGQSIGTLTANGDANILGTLEIEFDGAAAGQKIDLLAIGGNITLGANSILDLKSLGAALTDSSYVFASYGGTLTGTFGSIAGLQSGYSVNYAFNGQNIALVSAVPEPSSLLLLTPLVFAAAVRRRRR